MNILKIFHLYGTFPLPSFLPWPLLTLYIWMDDLLPLVHCEVSPPPHGSFLVTPFYGWLEHVAEVHWLFYFVSCHPVGWLIKLDLLQEKYHEVWNARAIFIMFISFLVFPLGEKLVPVESCMYYFRLWLHVFGHLTTTCTSKLHCDVFHQCSMRHIISFLVIPLGGKVHSDNLSNFGKICLYFNFSRLKSEASKSYSWTSQLAIVSAATRMYEPANVPWWRRFTQFYFVMPLEVLCPSQI